MVPVLTTGGQVSSEVIALPQNETRGTGPTVPYPAEDTSDVASQSETVPKGGPATCWALNVRSITKNAPLVFDLLEEGEPAVLAMTETWLKPGHSAMPQDLIPIGYTFLSKPRAGKRGGGVGALVKTALQPAEFLLDLPMHSSYELLTFRCGPTKASSAVVNVLYHPPHDTILFLKEFTELCDTLISSSNHFILLGDFNVHINIKSDPHTEEFLYILASRDIRLVQEGPTHEKGNCLDLILVRGVSVTDPFILPLAWADHALVGMVISEWLPSTRAIHTAKPRELIHIRPWAKLQLPQAHDWMREHPSQVFPLTSRGTTFYPPNGSIDVEVLSGDLSDRWTRLRDEICPLRAVHPKTVSHARNRWFSEELHRCKRAGRQLERRWRKSLLPADRLAYRAHISVYQDHIKKAKKHYLANSIHIAANDSKALFSLAKDFTAQPIQTQLPEEPLLCNKIHHFFDEKITLIRQNISKSACEEVEPIRTDATAPCTVAWPPDQQLTGFMTPSGEDMNRLISTLGPSSSVLDPLPTKVVKVLLPILAEEIRTVIDASLTAGKVPETWKRGIITPLLKKPTADSTILANFRPVSQLPLLARIAEAVVGPQLHHHCESRGVLHDCQSGFRAQRGTETALVDIQEQIYAQLDIAHPTALILLDLSAAFDTIDHEILLDRLERLAGISGTALDWCRSFLRGRSQQVRIGAARSVTGPVSCGVPQGSALSPILFNIYLRPLADILEISGLGCQMYADDTQLVVDLHPSAGGGAQLVSCLERIRTWMNANWLKLNEGKTEVLLFDIAKPDRPLNMPWPVIFGPRPPSVAEVRNLGVRFHQSGGCSAQIALASKAAHHQLNGLAPLMPILARSHRATLCRALALSRISYCNALLAGATQRDITRLQRVQNRAVRMVTGLRKFDHISEARRRLGWLKVVDEVKLKGLTIAWKALHKHGPLYLQKRFSWRGDPLGGRCHLLARVETARCARKRRGGRSLSTRVAQWWNDLPVHIRRTTYITSFRKRVKDHLLALDKIS